MVQSGEHLTHQCEDWNFIPRIYLKKRKKNIDLVACDYNLRAGEMDR